MSLEWWSSNGNYCRMAEFDHIQPCWTPIFVGLKTHVPLYEMRTVYIYIYIYSVFICIYMIIHLCSIHQRFSWYFPAVLTQLSWCGGGPGEPSSKTPSRRQRWRKPPRWWWPATRNKASCCVLGSTAIFKHDVIIWFSIENMGFIWDSSCFIIMFDGIPLIPHHDIIIIFPGQTTIFCGQTIISVGQTIHLQNGAPEMAFSCLISGWFLWFMVDKTIDNYSIHGVYKLAK